MSVMMYAGERETTQYQSIPMAPQLRPSHAGGVIALQRHYQGIDSRWTHRGELGVPVTFTTGLNYENMSENRKGYNNYRLNNGMPEYGQKGDLRRDERNLMWNVDPYLQTQWQLTDKLSLDAGVRYSSVWFDSNDHYVTPGNGDDSGEASYHQWLPAGSLKYALTDAWNLYLAAGRGFETPTINELSYRADGQSGMNFDLKPSTNDTVEIGSKTRIGDGLLTAALFQTDTDDELVVDSSSGGRTTYKNAGKTRRQGRSSPGINALPETGGSTPHGPGWMPLIAVTCVTTRTAMATECPASHATWGLPRWATCLMRAGMRVPMRAIWAISWPTMKTLPKRRLIPSSA